LFVWNLIKLSALRGTEPCCRRGIRDHPALGRFQLRGRCPGRSRWAALDTLERVTKIDLVLIDFAMPGMSGVAVARRAQAKQPAIPILFVTGFADRAALAGVSEAHIIGKPFIGSELSALALWRR
jgi:CheY-like chemotaxis protein